MNECKAQTLSSNHWTEGPNRHKRKSVYFVWLNAKLLCLVGSKLFCLFEEKVQLQGVMQSFSLVFETPTLYRQAVQMYIYTCYYLIFNLNCSLVWLHKVHLTSWLYQI